MKVRKGLVGMGIAAALTMTLAMAPRADAAQRGFARPGFSFYYGSGPGWNRPWAPRGYVPAPATGDVRVNTPMRGASIYVDGGFAGTTGKLKKFSLRPGNHLIEVRDTRGRGVYENRIHVIAGQTVDIHC